MSQKIRHGLGLLVLGALAWVMHLGFEASGVESAAEIARVGAIMLGISGLVGLGLGLFAEEPGAD